MKNLAEKEIVLPLRVGITWRRECRNCHPDYNKIYLAIEPDWTLEQLHNMCKDDPGGRNLAHRLITSLSETRPDDTMNVFVPQEPRKEP